VNSCLVRHLDANQVGRDFVVGDIHGCFSKLSAELERLRFDRDVDRLFSVGDLVDRGPESAAVVDWGMIGIVHGDCPFASWSELVAAHAGTEADLAWERTLHRHRRGIRSSIDDQADQLLWYLIVMTPTAIP
jgi:hypothetical protein